MSSNDNTPLKQAFVEKAKALNSVLKLNDLTWPEIFPNARIFSALFDQAVKNRDAFNASMAGAEEIALAMQSKLASQDMLVHLEELKEVVANVHTVDPAPPVAHAARSPKPRPAAKQEQPSALKLLENAISEAYKDIALPSTVAQNVIEQNLQKIPTPTVAAIMLLLHDKQEDFGTRFIETIGKAFLNAELIGGKNTDDYSRAANTELLKDMGIQCEKIYQQARQNTPVRIRG
jgi:hypothetical protein